MTTSHTVIGWNNLADGATLSTDSAVSSLPIQNLLDTVVAKKWRTGLVTAAYILFDLGSVQQVSAIALLGHNLSIAGTWRLRASDTDATATGSLTLNVAASTTGVFPDLRPAAKRFGQPNGEAYYFGSAASVRYGRIDLSDASLSYLQAGRLVVMNPTELTHAFSYNAAPSRNDGRLAGQARGGQVYMSRGFRQRRWRFSLTFRKDTGEAWTVADALDRDNGLVDDVLVCLDTTQTTYLDRMTIFGAVVQQSEMPLLNLKMMRRDYTIDQRL